MSTTYCTRCTSCSASATPTLFDDNGVCSGCRVSDQKQDIDWPQRKKDLLDLADEYRTGKEYDVLIPVSGGKDSYYQTHIAINELGLKPLLVTYHANNYLDEGEYNLQRMRDVFRCDHIIFRPETETLIKLNRIGFLLHGDMNWHGHCGIFTYPIQIAVKFNIPLVLWGEHGFMDLGGMYSYRDEVEYTAKHRLEHGLHGFDWHDFTDEGLAALGRPELAEGLTAQDMLWAQYPSDDDIYERDIRGIYLSNYLQWDGYDNYKLVEKEYGWRPVQTPFERTYRTYSNVDDMHENGIHDYLKFVKFGYGRGTDHTIKDIRAGRMTRAEAVEWIRKLDHVKPRRDLERWLEYVGMDEAEFDAVADSFRDPAVWTIENGQWVKDTIWGKREAFGPVHLPAKAQEQYISE